VSVYFPRGTLPPIHEDYPYLEITSDENITIVAKIGAPSVRRFRDHGGPVEVIGYIVNGEDGLEVANCGMKFLRLLADHHHDIGVTHCVVTS
jgi:hypothetical protein